MKSESVINLGTLAYAFPLETYLYNCVSVCDPDIIHLTLQALKKQVAQDLQPLLIKKLDLIWTKLKQNNQENKIEEGLASTYNFILNLLSLLAEKNE